LDNQWEYKIAGDQGILIKFGNEVTEKIFREVVSFEEKISKSDLPGILETIRAYCTLLVFYDPKRTNYEKLINQLRFLAKDLPLENAPFPKAKVIEIPVVYGGSYSPDLPLLSQMLHMSEEEVVRRHLSHDYLVYITAFLCGTAFFKGTDEIFHVPRKKTPALLHPEGDVNLANGLGTVFSPVSTPTGWYGIGRSPLRQWYPHRDPPVLIKSGDWIRYKQIDESEFIKIRQEIDNNRYELKSAAPR
jgi:inhibitor of KinA